MRRVPGKVEESVYSTTDDYAWAVTRVDLLNAHAKDHHLDERYGIVETRAYKVRDVKTADRWLILVRKPAPDRCVA